MKRTYLLLFIIFFQFFHSSVKTDTLSKYNFVQLETKIHTCYGANETEKFKLLSRYYLSRASKEKNTEKISEGYIFMHFTENFSNSLKYLDSLKIVSNKLTNNVKYPARVYLLMGNLYFKNDDSKNALSNYLLGIEHAKEKNNKKQIALAEIQIAYLNNYIGKHREAIQSLRKYLFSDIISDTEKDQIHLNLADTYIEVNKIDSANILIKQGLAKYEYDKKSKFYNAYLSLSGYSNLKTRNYKSAIEKINKSIPFFVKGNNTRDIVYSYMYLGEAYIGLKNDYEAVDNFKKIDSIVMKDRYTFPELRNVYSYLIDYYKEKNQNDKYLY